MAVFEVQGPDGETYEIDAPDEGAALKAFQSFKPQPNQSQQPASQGFQPFAQAPEQEKALPWHTLITSAPGDAYDIGAGLAKGAYGQAASMFDTVDTPMGKLPLGHMGPFVKGIKDLYGIAKPIVQDPQGAYDAAAQGLDQNFGTPTRAWNTVAQNPVDALLMAAPGLGMASKGVATANMPRLSSGLSKTAAILDPVSMSKKAIEGTANLKADLFTPVPDGQTRGSAALLRRLMPENLDAMDVSDQSMLLDASPSMTGLARGVTASVGKGADDLAGKLIEREKGKSIRMKSGAEQIFGKGRDPVALKAMIDKNTQKQAGAIYKKATQNPAEFRDDALENELGRKLTNPAKRLSGPSRDKNLEWMNQVDDAMAADTPRDAVARLHDLRKRLDAHTEFNPTMSSAEKADRRMAQKARNVVDDVLKTKVDKFKDGDALYSAWAKKKDDFDFGFDSLKGGEGAMFPETFDKSMKGRTGTYVKQGQSSRIANAMGTQSNDMIALRKLMGGDGDFNRAKLESTFGPRKVDDSLKLIDAEGQMSQNFADIVRNSKTAQSLQAAKLIENNQPFKVDSGLTTLGLGAKVSAGTANFLLKKVAGRVSSNTSDALAKALAGNKSTSQELLNALNKTKSVSLKDKTLIRAILFSGAAQASQPQP